MTRYGFAIDLTRCIGCHACSLACKAEHQVPVGVHRCWVKSVERGLFPETTRLFFPVLCNQCDHAPCVAICPTGALSTRPDGIVEHDGAACIGCRACMQACPYDQLFIDPGTRTAEKCNFCANRLEIGLLPACVSVCPTECRLFGDVSDAGSAVGRLVRERPVKVRKPEKATGPNIFYVGADDSVIRPELAAYPVIYKEGQVGMRPAAARAEKRDTPGHPRVDFDVPHAKPWDNAVLVYLFTKGVSAGVLLLSAILWWLGHRDPMTALWGPLVAAVCLAIAAIVLVADLCRPARFPFILTRPNWRSWLTRGALALVAQGVLAACWVWAGWIGAVRTVSWLSAPAAIAAVAAASYTGPLFAQAAGRDLWQGWRSAPALLLQALIIGAAGLLIALWVTPLEGADALRQPVTWMLAATLAAHAGVLLSDVAPGGAVSLHGRIARRAIWRGRYAIRFWWGAIGAGVVVPLLLLAAASAAGLPPALLAAASAFAIIGTCAWHDVWVEAGQSVPLS